MLWTFCSLTTEGAGSNRISNVQFILMNVKMRSRMEMWLIIKMLKAVQNEITSLIIGNPA